MKHWGKIKRNNTAIVSVIYVTLIFVIIKLIIGFHFGAGDDGGMARIFSGRMTGTPEMMPMFGSWLFSFIVSSLYKLNGSIGWYSWIFIFLMWLSSTVICYCFLNETKKLPRYGITIGLIAFTLIFFSFLYYFSVNITFSIVPVACGAAVILLTLSEKENRTKPAKIYKTALYIILLIAAMTIRKETSYTLLVVYLGTLFIKVIAFEADFKESLQKVLIIITIFGTVLVTDTLLTDEEWSAVIKTRNGPGTWIDHTHLPYEGNEDLYSSINWTEAEYNMAEVYMMLDEDFTDENFKILNNALEEKKETAFSKIKNELPVIFIQSGVDKYMVLAAAVLTLTACIFCIFGENKRMILAPLCYFAGFLVLFLYIVSNGRVIKHAVSVTYIIALLPLCFCTFKILVTNWYKICSKTIKYGCVIAVTGILFIISYSEIKNATDIDSIELRALDSECMSSAQEYVSNYPENVFFFFPLYCGHTEPEQILNSTEPSINLISCMGWQLQTPLYKKQLNNNGIEESNREIFLKENVYVIYGTNPVIKNGEYCMNILLDYIHEEYPDAKCVITEEKEFFNVCRVTIDK